MFSFMANSSCAYLVHNWSPGVPISCLPPSQRQACVLMSPSYCLHHFLSDLISRHDCCPDRPVWHFRPAARCLVWDLSWRHGTAVYWRIGELCVHVLMAVLCVEYRGLDTVPGLWHWTATTVTSLSTLWPVCSTYGSSLSLVRMFCWHICLLSVDCSFY